MLSPLRQFRLPKPQSSFSFHGCTAECTVEDLYSGPPEYSISVLLPACEDLTVALQNLPVATAQKISSIYGLFRSSILLARNILYLKLLQDETFDPTNKDDISYLWNIWYDMRWSSKIQERFLKDINHLCDGNLPINIHVLPGDMKQLTDTWTKWALMATEKTDPSVLEQVKNARQQAVAQYVQKCMSSSTGDIGNTLEDLWDWVWSQTKAHESLKNLPPYYVNAALAEMKSHFTTGNSSYANEETSFLNPMFLKPENMTWDLSPETSPFESFLLEKYEPREGDIMTPYLRALSERVQEERRAVKSSAFHLFQGNVFDITYHGALPNNFDVIDFSGLLNLTEDVGLAHILNASSLLLSENPHAILLTESSPWRKRNPQLQTVKEFVEESLETKLTSIPSLYGFTLRNHLRLGNPLPLLGSNRGFVRLCWKKSPAHNLKVKLCSLGQEFIARLQDKCFGVSLNEQDGKQLFSPLSYSLFISSLTGRVLLDDAEESKLYEPKVPANYSLGWKTIQAWMIGANVVRVEAHFSLTRKETGALKLVLINDDLLHDQYFENFQMTREGEILKVSFLLLKDNALDYGKTIVYLCRGARNMQITSHLTLQDAQIEDYKVNFPFKKVESPSESHFPCDETEDSYCVYLQGVSQENLGVSTDLTHLSEASHEIRINGPDFDKTIRFPWPFKISEVHSIGEPEDEPLRLILPKAIYEPHPFEWDRALKWSVDSLKQWSGETLTKDLNFHLSAQFQYCDLKRQIMDLPEVGQSGLRGVREVIRTIFQSAVIDGQCLFVIESKHDPRMKNLWFFRVHLPVRISPWGTPMLFLTANDHRLAQRLVDRGILEQAQATEDFKRFFVGGANSSSVASIYIQNEEEENILRYFLRLNSTKIDRFSWPIENLPSGKQNPWLATFLIPSYVDFAGTDGEMNDLLELTNNLAIVSEESRAFKDLKTEPVEFCTKCSKLGNLKRCSRCKSVKYCSLECQKSDWAAHKTKCAQIVTRLTTA